MNVFDSGKYILSGTWFNQRRIISHFRKTGFGLKTSSFDQVIIKWVLKFVVEEEVLSVKRRNM